jgi:multimeric flavodoxin WrbA
MNGNVLLLVGSPRKEESSSNALGGYLLERLSGSGWTVETGMISDIVRDEAMILAALEKMDKADLVVLSFPLYIDSWPSQMIRFLEMAYERRKDSEARGQKLIALCQSGFPESSHNSLALQMCASFAQDAHYHFAGGLAIGGGGVLGGADIHSSGMLRKLRQALDLTADALTAGNDLPPEATALVSKGTTPKWLYVLIVNRQWKKQARENGVDINAKPHA